MSDLLENIARAMEYADPEGANYAKLVKLRDCVERNVMLGPGAIQFIARLLEMQDNVECQHLRRNGSCMMPEIAYCDHTERYRRCPYYLRQRPGNLRQNSMAIVPGGSQ